jgi:hypothetical protein
VVVPGAKHALVVPGDVPDALVCTAAGVVVASSASTHTVRFLCPAEMH